MYTVRAKIPSSLWKLDKNWGDTREIPILSWEIQGLLQTKRLWFNVNNWAKTTANNGRGLCDDAQEESQS